LALFFGDGVLTPAISVLSAAEGLNGTPFEPLVMPIALKKARPYGLAIDVEHTTFFVGRETLVPSAHPVLGRWRTWLYIQLAANALSPARFYCLPPNRVVELGAQITI
jgi:KUP system potassium uptake protein